MPKGPRGEHRPADLIDDALKVACIPTGEQEDEPAPIGSNAAQLGPLGGVARAKGMTPEQRAEIAKKAVADQKGDLSPGTLAEAIALQEIEGNPLTTDEIEMFEMFERENWSFERRRAYVIDSIKAETSAHIE